MPVSDEKGRPMPEFGDNAGEFVRNLIHSLQEEAERLPPLPDLVQRFKEFDPSPERITDFAGKCAEAVTSAGKVLADVVRGTRESGKSNDPMPEHIEIPDDLSDLG